MNPAFDISPGLKLRSLNFVTGRQWAYCLPRCLKKAEISFSQVFYVAYEIRRTKLGSCEKPTFTVLAKVASYQKYANCTSRHNQNRSFPKITSVLSSSSHETNQSAHSHLLRSIIGELCPYHVEPDFVS
jgi:hypothetical protein